jgi:hypothetical protein
MKIKVSSEQFVTVIVSTQNQNIIIALFIIAHWSFQEAHEAEEIELERFEIVYYFVKMNSFRN